MRGHILGVLISCCCLLPCLAEAQAQASCQFQFFSAPQGYTDLLPLGINDYGNVVGLLDGLAGGTFGFVRYNDGTWKVYQAHPPYATWFSGRNDSGVTVGAYDSPTGTHGLVLYQGVLRTVDYPGAAYTALTGINRYGTIVGYHVDAHGNSHGFKLQNGQFYSINYPGALSTTPQGISDLGTIVGLYQLTSGGNPHAFVRSAGIYRSFSDPQGTSGTELHGANTSAVLFGNYLEPSFIFPAAFRYKNGAFQNIVVSGSTSTTLGSNNNKGNIVGRAYYQSSGEVNGFIASCQ